MMAVINELILIYIGLSRLGKVLISLLLSQNLDEMCTNLGSSLITQFYNHISDFNWCHVESGQFSVDLASSQAVLESVTCAMIGRKCSGSQVEMTDSGS